MVRLQFRMLLLLLIVAAAGCECGLGGGSCDSRKIEIKATAPPERATTSSSQKFGLIVKDSESDPESLVAAVRPTGGAWVACQHAVEAEQAIDGAKRARGEFVFYCPVTAATLPGGQHEFVFSADGARNGLPVRKTTSFFHDVVPPKLTASIQKQAGSHVIVWDVAPEEDFAFVGLYVNKVRVNKSKQLSGVLRLDESVRRVGTVEMRAVDLGGNASSVFLTLR